jgi:hypothetical protein
MSIYNDYDFDVLAVHPSGMLTYQSGKASSQRKFRVPAEKAEEFALRLLGKFYSSSGPEFPALPAPFPFDQTANLGYGQVNLVASDFSIEPLSVCSFNNMHTLDAGSNGTETDLISDPTKFDQMERYFGDDPESDNSDAHSIVIITYVENPCDCAVFNYTTREWEVNAEILPNTCISVERNPAYEMFTLPNGNLVWEDIAEEDNRRLKADSYAYKIIPKADIIVHWHNVPVNRLCQIETHLTQFRGCVNEQAWGDPLFCDYVGLDGSGNPGEGCSNYEPETILFVDWQEDRSKRTDAFGGMRIGDQYDNRNTTTLKLFFKQKRIFEAANTTNSRSDDNVDRVYGWNHLFLDRETGDDVWMRVLIETTGLPLFPLRAFSDIMYPTF